MPRLIMICIITAAMLAFQAGGPTVSREQFERILKAEAAAPNDLAFVYEGGLRYVGPDDVDGAIRGSMEMDFQGLFLMRADGAGAIDVYERPLAPAASVVRHKKGVLRNQVELARGVLDSKQRMDRDRDISKSRGTLLALSGSGTPFQIWISLILVNLGGMDQYQYTYEGWDFVDGRKCLMFRTALVPGGNIEEGFKRYWVDLERGANVLKLELHEAGRLTRRTDEIVLERFQSADGRRFWIPIRGRVESFLWRERVLSSPVFRETISVVHGSVQLDSGLPDSVFSVRRSALTPAPSSLGRVIRTALAMPLPRSFNLQPPAEASGRRPSIESVFQDADRQVDTIEASSAAREEWPWARIWQIVLAGVGLALLVAAGYYRWRSR